MAMARAPWHPEDIKSALRKRGSSLADIARKLHVSTAAVSTTIRYDNRRSRSIESAVAHALGVHPAAIWPTRYKHLRGRSKAAA